MNLKSRLEYIRDVIAGTILSYSILIKYYILQTPVEKSLEKLTPIAKRLGYGEMLEFQKSLLSDE